MRVNSENNMTTVNWLSIVLSFHLLVSGIQQVSRINDKAPSPSWLYIYFQGDIVYDVLSFMPLMLGVLMLLSMKTSESLFTKSLASSTIYCAVMFVIGLLAGLYYAHGVLSYLTMSIISLVSWVMVRQTTRERNMYDKNYCKKSWRDHWRNRIAILR